VNPVDAAVSRERLRALATAGWPLTYLAEQLGTSGETLSAIRRGKRARTAALIHQGIAYAVTRLRDDDPRAQGIPAGLITRTRLDARRHNWPAPGDLSDQPDTVDTTDHPATVEGQWAARTRPLDGGHLGWAGAYVLSWGGHQHSPAAIAFRIRTGHDPQGRTQAECGHRRCVHPGHVEDEPGRQHIRAQHRALRGLPPRPAVCARGHDQNTDGRLDAGGNAYCNACTRKRVAA